MKNCERGLVMKIGFIAIVLLMSASAFAKKGVYVSQKDGKENWCYVDGDFKACPSLTCFIYNFCRRSIF